MCGIAGQLGAGPDAACRVCAMLSAMAHRGPDQHGLWHDENVVLGHRRLSIIDLSEAGRQPMIDPDTGAVIVFNGEIYNYRELRAELAGAGRRFASETDTEVLLAAFAVWGERAVERLRGMFAFAIWLPRERELLLARDRLGIKPLYFAPAGQGFMFASELRALLATGAVRRTLDPRALHAYVWHGFVPGPRSIVDGVRLLEPGTVLRLDEHGRELAKRRYWSMRASRPARATQPEDAAAELRKAVGLHMVSDVPLGVFLSGGVDSSVIAAMAQQGAERPVTTFNVRFEESRYDESPHARAVAERLGTDHREVTLSQAAFADGLNGALESIDQPTFDAINTYFVSKAVREAGLTVALAGTGGDELFGGYSSFREIPLGHQIARALGALPGRASEALGAGVARVLMGRASEMRPQTRWGKTADLLATRGQLLELYQVSYGLFSRSTIRQLLLSPPTEHDWGLLPEVAQEWREDIDGLSPLAAVSALEMKSFLGERLLRDTDAASMAVSLEVRVPLLDHAFVETLLGVPDAARFGRLGKKQMLKAMVAEQLDPALFERPKAGFELPMAVWCRQTLAGEIAATLQDINLAHAIGLNAESVGRLWRAFSKGGPGLYWSRVWSLYVLMTWCRRHGVYLSPS